jgi:hypothetical protein
VHFEVARVDVGRERRDIALGEANAALMTITSDETSPLEKKTPARSFRVLVELGGLFGVV